MIFQIGAALTLQSSSLTLVFDWPVCFFSGMRLILIKWSTKVQVRQGKNHKTSWFLDVPKPKTLKKWLKYLKLNIQHIMAIISMEHNILSQWPSKAGCNFPQVFRIQFATRIQVGACCWWQHWRATKWIWYPGGVSGWIRRDDQIFSEDPWRSLVCKLVSWKHFGRFMQSFKLMFFFEF